MNKELYDLMAQFEKDMKHFPVFGRLDKESKELWKMGRYYQNGEVNSAFKMYQFGFAFGKTTEHSHNEPHPDSECLEWLILNLADADIEQIRYTLKNILNSGFDRQVIDKIKENWSKED